MKTTVFSQKSTYAYKTSYSLEFTVIDKEGKESVFEIHSVLWQMKDTIKRVLSRHGFSIQNVKEMNVIKLMKNQEQEIVSYSRNHIELRYFLKSLYTDDKKEQEIQNAYHKIERDLSHSFVELVRGLKSRYTASIPYLEELDTSSSFL